jgi:hypothetical protein
VSGAYSEAARRGSAATGPVETMGPMSQPIRDVLNRRTDLYGRAPVDEQSMTIWHVTALEPGP